MKYICGDGRKQTKIEIIEDYIDNDSGVEIINMKPTMGVKNGNCIIKKALGAYLVLNLS